MSFPDMPDEDAIRVIAGDDLRLAGLPGADAQPLKLQSGRCTSAD